MRRSLHGGIGVFLALAGMALTPTGVRADHHAGSVESHSSHGEDHHDRSAGAYDHHGADLLGHWDGNRGHRDGEHEPFRDWWDHRHHNEWHFEVWFPVDDYVPGYGPVYPGFDYIDPSFAIWLGR